MRPKEMQKTVLRFHRFFIDFSSQNRPWNASPHESPKKHRNWTENSCFLRLRRNFWPSGCILSIFFGSKKSLFEGPEGDRKKGRKSKENWGRFGAVLRNARGQREVRRVKTLRVLQGSAGLCANSAMQGLCKG